METHDHEKKKPRGRPFQKGNKFGSTSKNNRKELNFDLSEYILRSTNNGKLMADFYIGVLKTIKANKSGNQMVYNGVTITVELAKSANEWLTNNCYGKPSARKPPEDKVKKTEAELIERLRFLVKKVIKKEDIADKILVLLGEAGL